MMAVIKQQTWNTFFLAEWPYAKDWIHLHMSLKVWPYACVCVHEWVVERTLKVFINWG
jgi:hypothetical protein